jgi:hypothetical protein
MFQCFQWYHAVQVYANRQKSVPVRSITADRWVAVLDNKQIEVATSNCLSSCSIRPRRLSFATGVTYSKTYHFVCARPTYFVFVRVETICAAGPFAAEERQSWLVWPLDGGRPCLRVKAVCGGQPPAC